MNSKEKYRKLCETDTSIPFFSQAWWLDAVCGPSLWEVVIVEKGTDIIASMPLYKREKFSFELYQQPPLTQTIGPWIKRTNAKYGKMLARQKSLMQELINKLPPYDYFTQHWDVNHTNWLPFYWAGFSQTTRYTYILPDLSCLDSVWEGFQTNLRTDIRKASEKFGLVINPKATIKDFLYLNKLVFVRQGIKVPYSEDVVLRLVEGAKKKGCCKLFIASDKDGNNHAGALIVWDQHSAYYLLGGSDPNLRNSGATSLCLWEAIRFSSSVTKSFNFEGSMLESVEKFFRSFGAIQTPYFKISKTPSKFIAFVQNLKALV